MLNHASATLLAAFAILSAAPAIAADGQIVITQAKANAGNVTPGDAAGFPVTLSQPGSYILASNLQPPATKAGITITSNDVTIDLNGFRLNAAAGATTGIFGADFISATIRNGTITGFDAHGIYSTGENWVVEDMRVVGSGAYGIHVGEDSSVRDSTVKQSGNTGILCGARCLVESSTSSGNGGVGIATQSGTIVGNVIINNTGFGILGDGLVGYGNNTLAGNNLDGPQVNGGVADLHPNLCDPACPL
jgi:hypothetical protein